MNRKQLFKNGLGLILAELVASMPLKAKAKDKPWPGRTREFSTPSIIGDEYVMVNVTVYLDHQIDEGIPYFKVVIGTDDERQDIIDCGVFSEERKQGREKKRQEWIDQYRKDNPNLFK